MAGGKARSAVHTLSPGQRLRVLAALVEGCSVRSTTRLVGVTKGAILRLLVEVGRGCDRLHDVRVRGLHSSIVEIDETWSFIQKKQARVLPDEPPERGDAYTWVALDATAKLVICYRVGKRTADHATGFLADLRARVVGRPQLTSDGFWAYPDAVEAAFGAQVDYAQVLKTYRTDEDRDGPARYSPPGVVSCVKRPIAGHPDPDKISTSYVERFNLSTRMSIRRCTRLTNGFSKKLANHEAAISLFVAHYNFVRTHEALRITPAMAAGLADHVWSLGELLDAATRAAPPAPPRPPSFAPPPARPTLRLLQGGRA